ncbi:hypothetical protein ABIC63_005762 [Pseudacidovorax sp. 1753]
MKKAAGSPRRLFSFCGQIGYGAPAEALREPQRQKLYVPPIPTVHVRPGAGSK